MICSQTRREKLMLIKIQHPQFLKKRLSVETAGFLSPPKLLFNTFPVKVKKGGLYTVTSDTGEQIQVRMKYNFLDPVPKLTIGEESFELAEPLQWYEYAWIGAPMVMLLLGGAVGGFLGALSTITNGRIFRGERSAASKYVLAAICTGAAVIIWLMIAVAVQKAARGRH
jgi:hypothetical protein